jgi:hypothetical protein
MRVTEERYARDLRRLHLAARMVRLEARTGTICAWTGLPEERVRTLYRTAMTTGASTCVPRHRGPVPTNLQVFLRSHAARAESAAAAVLCRAFEAKGPTMADSHVVHAQRVAQGERLCQAYEVYRALCATPRLSFEHLLLLARELERGERLELAECERCEAVVLSERHAVEVRLCAVCRAAGSLDGATTLDEETAALSTGNAPSGAQIQLF